MTNNKEAACAPASPYGAMPRESDRVVTLAIRNARVLNAVYHQFMDADVYVDGETIAWIDYSKKDPYRAEKTIDAKGALLTPSLIDVHMHIESSMLTPGPFCEHLAHRGVGSIIAEPHEIGNVFGIEGIEALVKAGRNTPIDVFFGIPSSVPSTDMTLEGPGAEIDCEAMKKLADYPEAKCLGEVMNYSRIVREHPDLEVKDFIDWARKNRPSLVLEGHCPKLKGKDLARFIELGIRGDHTEHDLEELRDRFRLGMLVEVQRKMVRPWVMDYIRENRLYERTALVTDDVMAHDLVRHGHLDHIVRTAVKEGLPVAEAFYCATLVPARRMHLFDRGEIAPGLLADIALWDPETLQAVKVFKRGAEVPPKRTDWKASEIRAMFPEHFTKSVKLEPLMADELTLHADPAAHHVRVKVLCVHKENTQITARDVVLPVKDGVVDTTGYLTAFCFNRHGDLKPHDPWNKGAFALFEGDTIKEGAVATTWFHDHHNLFVMGADLESRLAAANRVIELQGGFVVTRDGEIKGELALPIAGILSDESVEKTAEDLLGVWQALVDQGYEHLSPVMSTGTLGLPCAPFFKLTDKGIVDVTECRLVPGLETVD